MPIYRVKPGRRWGPGKKKAEGDLVELTEAQASGFLDLLELVEDAPDDEPPVEAPGGGFNPFDVSVNKILTWLNTGPPNNQVAVVLQQERDGKNRVSAIEALAAYLEV